MFLRITLWTELMNHCTLLSAHLPFDGPGVSVVCMLSVYYIVIHLDRPWVSVVGMLWCQMLPRMLNLFALFSQILYTEYAKQKHINNNKVTEATITQQQHNNNDKTATNPQQ